MAKLRQPSAFPPGVYRGISFDRDRLREHIEGTNRAIQAGISIPLLTKHAPINANDKETEQFSAVEGKGWITKLFQDPQTGALGWEADNVPEDFAKAVEAGTVKLTSPEFRNMYKSEKEGVYEGPIVRHMAFTPLPGNPHQSPVETVALAEIGVFQFSELDLDNGAVQFYEHSKHHKALTKAGFEHVATGQGGWTHHYEHPDTGHEASISFNHSNDLHGKLDAKEHVKKKLEKHYASQHAEECEIADTKDVKEDYDDVDNADENEDDVKTGKKKKKDDNETSDEQFAEDEYDDLLIRHGYKSVGKADSGTRGWSHKEGHAVTVSKDGGWTHGRKDQKGMTHGKNIHDLGKHLGNAHAYAEDPNANPKLKKDIPEAVDEPVEVSEPVDIVGPENPPAEKTDPMANNPDAPPKATDKTKMAAIRAGLAQKNIVVPSDWTFESESAEDILLGCLNSALKAEQTKEAEEEPEDNESSPQETSMPFSESDTPYKHLSKRGWKQISENHYTHKDHPENSFVISGDTFNHYNNSAKSAGDIDKVWQQGHIKDLPKHLEKFHSSQHSELNFQFSEEQLSALPPAMRAIVEKAENDRIAAEKEKIQFAEREAVAKRELAKTHAFNEIKSMRLPPVIMNRLTADFEANTVQFSEGVEQPLYTASQVAEMIDKALPPDMRFAEADLTNAEEPKDARFFEHGDVPSGHVSPERARELVAANPFLAQYPQAKPIKMLPQIHQEENDRNPNLVMR